MERKQARTSKWLVPAAGLVIGGVYFVAAVMGGSLSLGISMLAVMVVYVGILVVAGRFDVVRVLRGQPADERYRGFNLQATAFATSVLILALLGAFVYEIATGGDGEPYSWLGALFTAGYVSALLWHHWRS